MVTLRLVVPLVCALTTTGLVGCAADTDGGGGPEGVTGDELDLTTARDHFAARDVSLTWEAGCGVVRPGAPPCYSGLSLGFTKPYIDLGTSARTTVNNTTKTITVGLDTWSPRQALHSAVVPQPEQKKLGTPQLVQIGSAYTGRVVDTTGAVLWTGPIATHLAI
jgi:hypothetical protein